jgi:hypothetical protein
VGEVKRVIRIYFEVLEQATELIVPLICDAWLKENERLPIQLVRANWGSSRGIGPIETFLRWNSPDVLISVIAQENGKLLEYPLLAVEFSEAVKTEDHELQRATVAIAGYWSGICVLKLSGEKTSAARHGGNIEFDPLVLARVLEERLGCTGYFYQPWPSDNGALIRNPSALSCPPVGKVPLLKALIRSLVAVSTDRSLTKWTAHEAGKSLLHRAEFDVDIQQYRRAVRSAVATQGGLIDSVLTPANAVAEPTTYFIRRALVSNDDTLYVKINRFDHAADPDRGVLTALSSVWSGPVRATYQISDRGKTRKKPALRAAFETARSAIEAFAEYSKVEGLLRWFIEEVVSKGKVGGWVDCTASIEKHESSWSRSVVLRTLFSYSDGILVQLRRTRTEWFGIECDRSIINSHPKAASRVWQATTPQLPRPVALVTRPNEDEVTWVTVHQVLKPNGFRLLYVSFPGHQGGGAILDGLESGRTRSRTYVDIIAIAPGASTVPSLTEAKDVMNAGLIADVEKLKRLRTEHGLHQGLSRLLHPSKWDGRAMLLSVAFGGEGISTWQPNGIDFIVVLDGRNVFRVAPFGNARKYFHLVEGDTKLPPVYKQV